MGFFAAIPALLGMGASAAGAEASREGTVEGAKSQARIEAMKRAYAMKRFEEDLEMQKPFYEAGLQAGVKYGDAIKNRLDPTKSGAYQFQKGLMEKDLKGAPEYVREGALSRLGAMEGEKQKSRLMDLQQIGLGASAQAGTSGLNLGNVLAQSYGISGGAMAQGTQSGYDQRQSMYNVAASQLSGLPSYMAANRTQHAKYDTEHMGTFNQSMVDYGGIGGY